MAKRIEKRLQTFHKFKCIFNYYPPVKLGELLKKTHATIYTYASLNTDAFNRRCTLETQFRIDKVYANVFEKVR